MLRCNSARFSGLKALMAVIGFGVNALFPNLASAANSVTRLYTAPYNDNTSSTGSELSVDAMVATWFTRYKAEWGVNDSNCHYTMTYYSNGEQTNLFAHATLTGPACAGGQNFTGTLKCPGSYVLSGSVCQPTGARVLDSNRGQSNAQCNRTNPINGATGNKFQRENDYTGAGFFPLVLERFYNSESSEFGVAGTSYSGLFGARWSSTYDRSIKRVNSTVFARRPDGKVIYFVLSGATWVGDPGVTLRLEDTGTEWIVRDEQDMAEGYDTSGRLIWLENRAGLRQTLTYTASQFVVSDPFGRTLTFIYDSSVSRIRRVSTVIDPANLTYTYTYDAGRLATVLYPGSGQPRIYHYGETGSMYSLSGITDENGKRFATWTYDAQGRADSSQHAAGVDYVHLDYNADGSVTLTDALETVRTQGFTVKQGVTRLSSQTGAATSYCRAKSTEYDDNGFVHTKTDFNENVTEYTFNARGLEELRIEALGTLLERKIDTEWHADFRVPTHIYEYGYDDELLRHTWFTHYDDGSVQTKTVVDEVTGESRTTTWTYTELGQVWAIDGPRTDVTDVTTYTYYECNTGEECGQVHFIENALEHVTEITDYDDHGNPLTVIDPNGVTTTLTYDPQQRLETRTVAGATTEFDYDAAGLLDRVILPDDSFLDYDYDDAHRLTDIRLKNGAGTSAGHIHYTLDPFGNRKTEEVFDPSGELKRKQSRVFDSLGLLDLVKNAAGDVVMDYGYDVQGNRTSQTDYTDTTTGYTTTYVLDALNRAKDVIDPASNGTTTYGYNALDQVVSVQDQEGLVTSYTINALGDLTEQSSPDTGATAYPIYDAAGNRKRQVDARGVQVDYQYDALNRLKFVDYPGTVEDVTYVYDGANYTGSVPNGKGRLTGITEHGGASTTTILYDARGTVNQELRVIDGTTYTTGYGYDLADRLTSVTYPTGRVVNYERNGFGQIAKVTSAVGAITTTVADFVTYLPFGAVTSYTLNNGVAVTRTYDADYRLTEIKDQGTSTIQHLDPDFDLRGNIKKIDDLVEITRSQTFDYDAVSRMTFAHGAYGDLTYSYDGVGNRTSETVGSGSPDTYTYPVPRTTHHLQSQSSGVSFTHDDAGAIETKGGLQLTYNNAHRASVIAQGGTTVNNLYNAAGQRLKKSVGDDTTLFFYDQAGHLLAEKDLASPALTEYVWLGDLPLLQGAMQREPDAIVDNTDLGFSKTGTWAVDLTRPGYYGVDYLTHGGAGSVSGSVVVDDGEVNNVTMNGPWYPWVCTGVLSPSGCVNGDMYISPGAGSLERSFTWRATLPRAGKYFVMTAWWTSGNRAPEAKYSIQHAAGTTDVIVDQQVDGNSWRSLGTYDFASGDTTITLSAPAGQGDLIADAVRLIPLTDASGASTVDEAHWAPPETLDYEVYARWPGGPWDGTIAPSALYRIRHSGGETEVTKNHQVGGTWSPLGTFTFTDLATQGIFLRADLDRTVLADVMRFVPVGNDEAAFHMVDAYYHVDHLGTPQKLTAADQTVLWDASYEPFGNATLHVELRVQPLRFPGQYFDAETGLHQNWNRDYDPSLGRYLQSDPIGLAGGLSTYGYASASPLNRVDPTGLWSTEAHNELLSRFAESWGLNDSALRQMQRGSRHVDDFQGDADSFMHWMTSDELLDKKQACAKAREFMKSRYDLYRGLRSMRGQAAKDQAYYLLGMSLHTVMDSTSPAHEGLQYWHLDWGHGKFHGDMPKSKESLDRLLDDPARLQMTLDLMDKLMEGNLPGCECE